MEQFCQDRVNIVIVGGGPSGVYCALNIASELDLAFFENYKITIFDKGQILRTLLPTGGGRCNITNSISDIKDFAENYPRGNKFLYSLFSRHFSGDTLEFFSSIGVKTYTQEDGRIFPVSNSAKNVRDKMIEQLKKYKKISLENKKISSIDELKGFDKIVLSCGSRGVEGLLESTKQPFVPFKKALCGLIVENFNYPQGVSVKSLDGDFIFTKDGISGPLAYKISSLNAFLDLPYNISIKLFDVASLMQYISENPKKTIGNAVSNFIPKSLARCIVDDFDKKACEVSKKQIEKYSLLDFKIIGVSPNGEVVNAGGVDLNSIDKNCKSKIKPNLWFCGEILNIDGFCGGFNLQNCWSSGFIVTKDIVHSII